MHIGPRTYLGIWGWLTVEEWWWVDPSDWLTTVRMMNWGVIWRLCFWTTVASIERSLWELRAATCFALLTILFLSPLFCFCFFSRLFRWFSSYLSIIPTGVHLWITTGFLWIYIVMKKIKTPSNNDINNLIDMINQSFSNRVDTCLIHDTNSIKNLNNAVGINTRTLLK